MENAGRAYTREQLLETVWGYDYEGGTRTVDVHVQTLRTKLGSSGRYVETVRGVGYRFGE
jgi:two-component system alkaline phosphatase synthesis response regulator PhoP